jgi:nucleotide-binding universal stress UspA family protein
MMKKVLVPLDGSAFSRQIVPLLRHTFAPAAYQLVLFRVGEQPLGVFGMPSRSSITAWPRLEYATPYDREFARHPIYADQQEHNLRAALEASLTAERRALEQAGYTVSVVVRFGDAAEEIVTFAREADVDLVAMATHGRSGLSHVLLGSVAEQVLRKLTIPVMLVRPVAEEL